MRALLREGLPAAFTVRSRTVARHDELLTDAAVEALVAAAARPAVMSVAMKPGAMAFTRMSCVTTSRASARVKPMKPALGRR